MLRITSNEKAVMGGLVTALVTVIAQVQQSGHLTLKEFGTALVGYVLAHLAVWTTTNSQPVEPPVNTKVDTPQA